jgi:putative phosphoribosyl transferase
VTTAHVAKIKRMAHAIPSNALELHAELMLPDGARGVVCVDVSMVDASELVDALYAVGFGTLELDLVTRQEYADARACNCCRNDVQLLAERLALATDWLAYHQSTRELPIGYWGTGTGSAVALMAAAMRPALVSALVSSNGRPLLARPALPQVQAPTLLVAVWSDDALVKVNRAALSQMVCEKRLELIEAPENASGLAQRWFEGHLI